MKRVPMPLASPWAITPEGMRVVLSVWSRGQLFSEDRAKALQARDGQPMENTRATEIRDGVAVIPVYGALCRHASLFTAISGATSYGALRKDLQVALDDPAVRAIVLDIDSPGGEVDGVAELAQAIFEARGKKRIVAYVGGTGASAAYWIASACDEVVCSTTSFLGSIGVRSMLVDDSARDLKDGIKEIDIISSRSPGKRDRPIDDDVIARAQSHVDKLADIFIGDVARHRGTTPDDVAANFGAGDVMVGADAVAAKLADRLGTLETLLVELSGTPGAALGSSPQPAKGARMARSMNPALATANRTRRAEGAPPVDPPKGKKNAEGEEMDGEAESDAPEGEAESDEDMKGEGDDAERCEDAEGDDMGAEDHEEPDEDDDPEKKKPVSEGDDKKDEKALFRSMAAKLGLPATASRREILLAANATAVPSATVEQIVDKRVSARLAAEQAKAKKAQARKAAEKLAASAVRGGYDAESKDDLIAFAMVNYKAAEKSVAHFLKNDEQLFSRHAPAGTERASAMSGQDTRVRRFGGVKVVKHGCSLSEAAKALAAKEKIGYEAALDRVVKEQPHLYQGYLNSL